MRLFLPGYRKIFGSNHAHLQSTLPYTLNIDFLCSTYVLCFYSLLHPSPFTLGHHGSYYGFVLEFLEGAAVNVPSVHVHITVPIRCSWTCSGPPDSTTLFKEMSLVCRCSLDIRHIHIGP